MARAGLAYLAALDPTGLPSAVQAWCLQEMERLQAMETAAQAWFLAAFTAGQGPADDACRSARSWLIRHTRDPG
jgi:hypothetical protein